MVNYLVALTKDLVKKSEILYPISFSCTCGLKNNVMKAVFDISSPLLEINQFLVVPDTEYAGKITSREIDFKNKTITYYGVSLFGNFENVFLSESELSVWQNDQHDMIYSVDAHIKKWLNFMYEFDVLYDVGDINDPAYFPLEDEDGNYFELDLSDKNTFMEHIKLLIGTEGYAFKILFVVVDNTNKIKIMIKVPASYTYQKDVDELNADIIFSENLPATSMVFYTGTSERQAYINVDNGISYGRLFNSGDIANQKYRALSASQKIIKENEASSELERINEFKAFLDNSGFMSKITNFTPQNDFMNIGDRIELSSRKFGIKTNPQILTEKTYSIVDGNASLEYNFSGGV